MRIPSFLLIPLLLQAAAVPTPVPTRMPPPRFASGHAALAIPIEVVGEGLAFVKGQVRGADVWLLLDTASDSVLSEKQAAKLGFTTEETDAGSGAGNRFPVRRLRDVPVRLPGVEILQAAVSTFDLDLLQTALGHRIDGILGIPFFESFVVTIDFAHATLSLADPKHFRLSGKGEAIALSREAGVPYVRARVTLPGSRPLEGEFLLDTGADSAAVLYSTFVDAHHLLGPAGKAAVPAPGSRGTNLDAVVRAEKLEVGSFLFRSPVLQLSRSTKGLFADSKHAGLIGGGILSRFQVTLDYARDRVILTKNPRFAQPFDYDASGLTLAAQGPDLSTFEVRRITAGSPAAAAGLVVGDVLLAIDGKPAKDFGLRQIRKMLQRDGKEYTLTVFREGEIRRVTLKCRKLL